jgi:hypothetical protein
MRTRLSLVFSAAAALHSAAWAQTAPSAQTFDPRDLLVRVRHNVTDTLARLPRYLCTLTIDRSQYAPATNHATSCDALTDQQRNGQAGALTLTDRLRLDVAIAASNEIYSWVGEDHFDNRDVFDLVKYGALQTGAYSNFLASIFRDNVATFSYNGETKFDGRELAEFSFQVPRERSHYVFGNRLQDSIVGYSGSFLADPETAGLVRLDIRVSDPPAESGACQAATTLDYTRTRLNDSDFLLPSEAQLDILNLNGVEMRNRTVYSSCHEFVGEAVLKFGDSEPGSAGASAAAPDTVPLPESLPPGAKFQIRFDQAIDTKTAAAGDRIQARLTSSIKDPSSKAVLIREGATIIARIVKLQHYFGAKPSVRMLVKLEKVSVGGSERPLNAAFDSSGPARRSAAILLGAWDAVTDPHVGSFEFRNAGDDFVVKSGLESTWITLQDSGTAIHP